MIVTSLIDSIIIGFVSTLPLRVESTEYIRITRVDEQDRDQKHEVRHLQPSLLISHAIG